MRDAKEACPAPSVAWWVNQRVNTKDNHSGNGGCVQGRERGAWRLCFESSGEYFCGEDAVERGPEKIR